MSDALAPDLLGPVRYPEVEVTLTGESGNAFAILGSVLRALRAAGISSTERDLFQREAASGSYDHLIQTCMRWVETS